MGEIESGTMANRMTWTLETVAEKRPSEIITFFVVFWITTSLIRSLYTRVLGTSVKAPYAGYRSIFEPAWLVRLRFSGGALPQINEGYEKVEMTCP